MFISIDITTILGVGVVIIRYKANLSSAKLDWTSQLELSLAITYPTHHHPQDSSDFNWNKHCKATGSSEGLIGFFGGSIEVEWGV